MELLEAGLGTIFLSETVGTMLLILLGGGVVANVLLAKTKGHDTGWLLINWGWGLAVFVGVLASAVSGGHLNPAVTIGFAVKNALAGLPVDITTVLVYIAAQLLGAMIGAILVWITYKQHYDVEENPSKILGTFATGPEIRNPLWNTITETIATFVLVFGVFAAANFTGNNPAEPANLGWLGALGVALLVFSIGISLGGPTGYAINPARDLGPRLIHAILPIPHKGSSDWGYSWVPIVGPILGGILAGLLAGALLPTL